MPPMTQPITNTLSQHSVSVLTVGLTGERRALVTQAAAAVASGAHAVVLGTVDEAIGHLGHPGREILVLGGSARNDLERAVAAISRDGLPRWPVVMFDSVSAGESVWIVPSAVREASEVARLLEAAVAQHAALREAARARGDLLTIARRINHEMRSPLGCILTMADMLREELAERSSTAQSLTGPIIDSAHEVLELLERVTLIARSSTGPPAMAPIDMGMVVWAAREHLEPEIAAAGAQVTEPETWPTLHGVQEWLERVWLALITNALRHAGPQPRIELGWERKDDEVRFFVRDHGAGVPSDRREPLFRPFHRLHESDSGRGLRLAIVQRLVQLHGGSCGYEAVKTGGSCFHFSLPDTAAPGS